MQSQRRFATRCAARNDGLKALRLRLDSKAQTVRREKVGVIDDKQELWPHALHHQAAAAVWYAATKRLVICASEKRSITRRRACSPRSRRDASGSASSVSMAARSAGTEPGGTQAPVSPTIVRHAPVSVTTHGNVQLIASITAVGKLSVVDGLTNASAAL